MPWKVPSHLGRQDRDREYEQARKADPDKRLVRQIRNSARWQKFRDWFKGRHPLCCDPFGFHREDGCTVPVAQVHHIKRLEAHPDLALVESNCAPVCGHCHAKLTSMERFGKRTEQLFTEYQREVET